MKEPMAAALDWFARWKERLLPAAAAVGAAVWLATHVQMLGEMPRNLFPGVQQLDMQLDYAVALLCWGVIAVGIWLLGGAERHHLLIGWVAKFFVMLVLMLFYEYKYRYNLDAYSYFSAVLTGKYFMYDGIDWRQQSWFPSFERIIKEDSVEGQLGRNPGTENMLRLLLSIAQLTGPHYHAIKVVFGLFGFLGVWLFYQAIVVMMGRRFPMAFYALMLYPSILFWSSILGKDPLFLFFTGLYAYGATLWLVRGSPGAFAWIGLALCGSGLLRPWMAMIQAIPFAFAVAVKQFGFMPVVLAASLGVPAMILGGGMKEGLQAFEADALLEEMATKAGGVGQETGSGAGITPAEAQRLVSSPAGFAVIVFSGLFRPLPFDITNMLVAVAALENTLLLILIIKAFSHMRMAYWTSPLFLWLFTYSVLWAGAYGLIVLANFGAGMRYKLQVLPVIVLIVISLLYQEGRTSLLGRKMNGSPSFTPSSSA